jgi:eukaryotic-like serine/threonine-protein kinase
VPEPHSLLQTLAEAVADGSPVDWDQAESSAASDEERSAVAQLRGLAQLQAAAREHTVAWGPLEIRSEIGRGTFGIVYRAWDTRLDREVALKLLHLEDGAARDTAAVVAEGRLLARIRHPNIVVVHGADTHDERVGLWMEFITGSTLKELLDEQGPFGPSEAALIGRDLCSAVAAVHKQGYLHRDIKAQNVMREAGGRIVLMDFGAGGSIVPPAGLDAPLAGTPVYLAPEVLAGGPPTVQSDLYSLGVLLFHLVSGAFPVTAPSLQALHDAHRQKQRLLLRDLRPDLPAAFVRAVDRATAPEPSERPASAGALQALLEQALASAGTPDDATSAEAVKARSSKRGQSRARLRRWAAAVLVLTAVAGWIALGRSPWRPAADRNSVAILPFKNLSPGGEADYFSEGLADDLVAQLSALRDLRVIAGTSMRRYSDRTRSEQDIGAELGVATVLDSSIRRSAERIRIVSRLVDARTGEQLWSESFERDVNDVVTMQNEVARKIAVALKGELSPPDIARLGSTRVRNPAAHTAYLKGRYYWGLRTEDGVARSIRFFNAALASDPNYAAAYAGLSDAYTSQGAYGFVPADLAYERAAAAARKAVALDGSLAEAHASLAFVQRNRFEWAAAEASFRKAIALKPGYASAHHWYSVFLTQHGRFPEAITEAKTAISLDPLSVPANMQLGVVLLMARRFDVAVAQFERTLQMDPAVPLAYRSIADAYTYAGEAEKAKAAFDRAIRSTPVASEDQELTADLAYAAAVEGRRDEALKAAHDLTERFQRSGEEVAGNIAAIYAGLGDSDRARKWLSVARDRRDQETSYLKVHPRWDSLRGDPRFDAILKSLGFTTTTGVRNGEEEGRHP